MVIDGKSLTMEDINKIAIEFSMPTDEENADSIKGTADVKKMDIGKVLEEAFKGLSSSVYGEDMDSLFARIAPCTSLLMLARAPESNAPVRLMSKIRDVEKTVIDVEKASAVYKNINVAGIVKSLPQEFVEVEDFI